jgi:hypothetical protein
MAKKGNSFFTIGLLIVTNFLAYGLFSRSLGFYLDDWGYLTAFRLNGYEGDGLYWFLMRDNRPASGFFFNFQFETLGLQPFHWHLYVLVLRILVAVMFWAILKILLEKQDPIAFAAAVLFSVYPTFKQTPTVITYSVHWVSLFLLLFSIWLSLWIFKNKRYRLPGTLLALLCALVSHMLVEYFIPLEFARGLALIVLAWRSADKPVKKITRTAWAWAPYILLMTGFLYWRLRLMPTLGNDRNYPHFSSWLKEPLPYFLKLLRYYSEDLYKILAVDVFNAVNKFLSTPPDSHPWMVIFFIIFVIAIAAYRFSQGKNTTHVPFKITALLLGFGLLAIGLGVSPGYAIGRHYAEADFLYNDRFALAATLGAAMVWAAALQLIPWRGLQAFLLGLLLACFTVFHLTNAQVYQNSTSRLKIYLWQLSWRAPNLQRGTAIFGNGEFVSKMGEWPLSMAFTNLYTSNHQDNLQLGYWFFDWDDGLPQDIDKMELYRAQKVLSFISSGRRNIGVMPPSPGKGRCLWVLSPADVNYPAITGVDRQLAAVSNLAQIQPQPNAAPPRVIFGAEPPHTWCYYYQKAALAAQFEEWDKVNQLWSTATEQGYSPKNAVEMSPFIRALYKTNQPQKAEGLLLQAYKVDPKSATYLCELVESLVPDNNSPDWRQTIPCP